MDSLISLTRTRISKRQLIKYFYAFLDRNPKPSRQPEVKYINLKVDAKYFGRWGCSIVFKEGTKVIYWHFCLRENYQTYLYCLSKLKELNYIVLSVTSDKHGSIISAVNALFPDIPHQYCLIHIQRRCRTLLTKKPETKQGQDLLEIVNLIHEIRTKADKKVFLTWLERYEAKYQTVINQRTYSTDPGSNKKWWYTHKNVRAAFMHLKSSLPNMFFYLDDPNIPKDTNGLEAEFTHLKTKLNIHRGLKRQRRINYTNWYWYQKSTQKFN